MDAFGSVVDGVVRQDFAGVPGKLRPRSGRRQNAAAGLYTRRRAA
jgi:hypothetical protein